MTQSFIMIVFLKQKQNEKSHIVKVHKIGGSMNLSINLLCNGCIK